MFQVVDRPKLYEQVVEQIKNMIVQGIYTKKATCCQVKKN